jgi:hypothetical protein
MLIPDIPQMDLDATADKPCCHLFATPDFGVAKRTQRGPKEEESGYFRGEYTFRCIVFRRPSQSTSDSSHF